MLTTSWAWYNSVVQLYYSGFFEMASIETQSKRRDTILLIKYYKPIELSCQMTLTFEGKIQIVA